MHALHFRIIIALNLHGNSPLCCCNAELMGEKKEKETKHMRKKRKCQKRKCETEKLKKNKKGETGRDRDPEREERRRIKNGCLFIHDFLFIQIACGPRGQISVT